jgi:hypothetical protein
MTHRSPPTIRPDLLGKTVVTIHDPYPHGEGCIPPSAYLGVFIAAEADYVAVRELGSIIRGLIPEGGFRPCMSVCLNYDLLEPGERLEEFLAGYGSLFGTPDYVYFQGKAREKWERDAARAAGDAVSSA